MIEKPFIIALDFPNKKETMEFLNKMGPESLYIKVGLELFYQEGPSILYELKEKGHRLFLDLKLHDIPNTVMQAMRRLAGFSPDMVNVHAAGGKRMMEAAIEGLDAGTCSGSDRPLCIAVTQLTSTSPSQLKNELLIEKTMEQTVLQYARLAEESGMNGVVCSVHEADGIYRRSSSSFLTVTPGIRQKDDTLNDQIRVADPETARRKNVSAIVVGRSITKSADPLEAYKQMKNQWEGITV
ncbi:orotidine-5'-phosphate decarboxylase [Metabacillus sp. RGM 3146]|uniref:orotidine-5'-phosphate decarboxylase n=1 Tax=Metabacillus sp. RGM 3146 TaxID=3401092 RepID=UPI003B9CF84A